MRWLFFYYEAQRVTNWFIQILFGARCGCIDSAARLFLIHFDLFTDLLHKTARFSPLLFSIFGSGHDIVSTGKGVIIFNNYSLGGGQDRTPHSYHLRALRLWQNQPCAESGAYPAKEREKVTVADLDIVNPYFRTQIIKKCSKSRASELSARTVRAQPSMLRRSTRRFFLSSTDRRAM